MSKEVRGGVIGGLILVILGGLALINQVFDIQWGESFVTLLMTGLALLFLVAGLLTRESGWFIPSGIIGGLAAGFALTTWPFENLFTEDVDGGVFLLAFAGGWVAITLMTAIFTDTTHWWALIPGAIIGLVGLTEVFGGVFENALELLNYVWPVALILGGAYILYRVYRPREKKIEEKPVEKQA